MLELSLLEATVVACYAAATVLDPWSPALDAFVLRVARDELWLVGPRSARCSLIQCVEQSIRPFAPDSLVVDQTDGWTVWSIAGPRASEALARLTIIPFQQGGPVFQGAVAGIPAKVIARASGYQVFVPAPVGHHLRERVLEACDDLAPAMAPPKQFDGRVR